MCRIGRLLFRRACAFIGSIESMTFEFNRHRRIHFSQLCLMAIRAYGPRVILKGLILGKIMATIFATVMVGRHRSSSTMLRSMVFASN
jgi:hypothetical protein